MFLFWIKVDKIFRGRVCRFLNTKIISGCKKLNFIIGSEEGLDSFFKDSFLTISFGNQTWPHLLVRVMLIEQIYRGLEIIKILDITNSYKMRKKVLVCILDGWGLERIIPIMLFFLAKKNFDFLTKKYGYLKLKASENDVGLPAGQFGILKLVIQILELEESFSKM